MMRLRPGIPLMAAGLIFLAAGTSNAAIQTVLSLVIDVSGSVDASEYDLQMNGYRDAFLSAPVQNYLNSATDDVAVKVVFFGTTAVAAAPNQFWILSSGADATAFANYMDTLARPFSGSTNIAGGMDLARTAIQAFIASQNGDSDPNNNVLNDAKKIIDVSGDGVQNVDDGVLPNDPAGYLASVRSSVQGDGIVVNGLAIGGPSITTYYTNSVVVNGGVVYSANDFDDFGDAVRAKIIREVTGQDEVPEPASLVCWGGLMLVGGAVARRRLRAA